MGRSSFSLDPPLDVIRDSIIHEQQDDELVPNLRRINLQCYCTYCHFLNNNRFVKVIKWFDLEAFELEERINEREIRSKLIEFKKSAARKEEEEAQARLDAARQKK